MNAKSGYLFAEAGAALGFGGFGDARHACLGFAVAVFFVFVWGSL